MANLIELIEYKDGSGLLLEIEYDGETLWLSVAQIAALFGTARQNVEYHIQNVYKEGELEPKRTSKKNLQVVENRPNYAVTVYNLDMVISVGYRVKSSTATKFRQWATQVIKDRISNNYAALAQEEAIRLLTRVQIDDGTERLVSVATRDHNVTDAEGFLAAGDRGLYRLTREEVEESRNIPTGRLYDYIGSAEMGMHVYRLTQTAEVLHTDAQKGHHYDQEEAESIHEDIAGRIRADSHLSHKQFPEEFETARNIELVKQKHRALLRKSQAAKAARGEQLDLGLELDVS